ncbi:hypothetical protein [Sorangium sp. So ce1078]|uniref:hypothetical protein n=1 Tax=Sorangium sp. So ce1078 TaxID=3133329 RepID=UPI003F6297AB
MRSPLAAMPPRAGRAGACVGVAAFFASHFLPVLYPVALAALVALLFVAAGHRRPRSHGGAATALGLTLLAPALLADAWLVLDQRIALGRLTHYDWAFVLVAAYAAPLAVGLSGRLGSLLAGRLLRRERAWLPPALRAASLATLALASALVAGAALRLLQRPSLDRYVASLPVAAVVPPVEGEPSRLASRGPSGFGGSARSGDTKVRVHDLSVAGLVVTRACNGASRCAVSLGPAEHPPPPNLDARAETVRATASLALRRDSAEDLVLLSPVDASIYTRPIAFRGPLLQPADLFPEDLVRAAGPPLGWLAVATAGVLFAGLVQRRRRRAQEHLARLAGAPAGTCDESGWITFDEPLPGLRLEPDDDCPTGRVLVVSGAARAATYRSAGPSGAVEALPGEKGELLAEARAELVRLDAVTLAAALLAAAPLATAAARGLVLG